MTTTQLFVELLIIGLGVVIWVGFLIAGIAGLSFEKSVLDIKFSLWPPLIAVAYVMGILLDRIAYSVFNHKKNQIKKKIFCHEAEPPAAIIERIVLESSEALNHMINYNRSRARICRSWFINFFLIGATFLVWQVRVNQISNMYLIFVTMGFFVLSLVSCLIGGILEKDHYNNIRHSYDYLRMHKNTEDKSERNDTEI